MNSIGIIIVSFNTCKLLQACLASLRDVRVSTQIVVVDNGSRDETVAMVRSNFPHVTLIEPAFNLGFAGANNLGLAALGFPVTPNAAHGYPAPDAVLLLNPDTVVHPGAIEALAEFLEQHPRVGMVGPRLLNPDGSIQSAAFRFPTLSMTVLDVFPPGEVLPGRFYNSWWQGRYPQERSGDEPFPIDHPLGACMLVRAEVLHQVGGFDADFFMYAEEVDWCYRIRAAGWSIWQLPMAQVTHVGGASTSQLRARMLIALNEGRLRFFRKHYSSTFIALHRLIVRLGMLRAVSLSWLAYWRGEIDRSALRERLWAFGRVFQL